MRVSEAFPSNYVKAADLQGKAVTVVIDHATMEKLGNDQKMVVYFQGKSKGMVVNKTNASNIAHLYGDNTDDWTGREIVLFPAWVDFQGKTVEAIRVRGPQARDRGDGAPAARSAPQAALTRIAASPQTSVDLDDEIPF